MLISASGKREMIWGASYDMGLHAEGYSLRERNEGCGLHEIWSRQRRFQSLVIEWVEPGCRILRDEFGKTYNDILQRLATNDACLW